MSFASNSVVRETFPRVLVNASRTQAVCAAPQIPPNILTYSYNSRLVYVTPGETYEQAIDFAQEAFPELRDVDRSLICLEVRVIHNCNGQTTIERKRARIGRMAWAPVVATLVQYEIVEIQVASLQSAASSTTQPSVAQPPPYASETGWYTATKGPNTSEVSLGHQSHTCSLTTRVVGLFSPRSSRDRQLPHSDPSHSS